jgi:hypothetical protein
MRSLLLGWLYADLLLVLFIAAMGNVTAPAETARAIEKTPAPAPQPKGLDPKPITLTVRVDRDRLADGNAAVQRAFARRVSRRLESAIRDRDDLTGREARVGLSITFGYDRSLGRAQEVAREANRVAKRAQPRLFRNAVVKSYGSLSPGDRVTYEIYLYRARGTA